MDKLREIAQSLLNSYHTTGRNQSPEPPQAVDDEMRKDIKSKVNAAATPDKMFKEYSESILDPFSPRTKSFRRLIMSLSLPIVLLSFWSVNLEQVTLLGVSGSEIAIGRFALSISIILGLAVAAWWAAAHVDRKLERLQQDNAKRFIKKRLNALRKVPPWAFGENGTVELKRINDALEFSGSNQPSAFRQDDIRAINQTIYINQHLHRARLINSAWRVVDKVLVLGLVCWAIWILLGLPRP